MEVFTALTSHVTSSIHGSITNIFFKWVRFFRLFLNHLCGIDRKVKIIDTVEACYINKVVRDREKSLLWIQICYQVVKNNKL